MPPRKKTTAVAPATMTANQVQAMQTLLQANRRSLRDIFGTLLTQQTNTKHNNWYDFGFPEVLTFDDFYRMYTRSGIGRGGVARVVEKCWQDFPWLLESEEPHDETETEAMVRVEFERLQFWSRLMEADEKSRVGEYAGIIFRFADGQMFDQPVTRVNGLPALVELIPVYEKQLTVSTWDMNQTSATYGQPTMYTFNEANVMQENSQNTRNRAFNVHPDRVHIWSRDSTVFGESALKPGFNDLITIEKIIGSGGEGFWKNAKSAPVLEMDKDANINTLATMLGVEPSGIADKMDEVIGDWQQGFDQLLMLQGINAKTLGVTLPQPEEFVNAALQSFCASIPIPMKVLMGSQTGERASTEDANEWNQTCQARRTVMVKPNIMRIVAKLERFGVLPERDWFLSWSDLTESTMDQKIDRAAKMADINQKMMGRGEVFTPDEIREVIGMEAVEQDDGADLPDDVDDDESDTAAQ